MSSSLTFQLRNNNQVKDELVPPPTTTAAGATTANLPSPPTSTYSSDEAPSDIAGSYSCEANNSIAGSIGSRRDSLPTHFNALTIQQFSTSLPENYTIEHSSSPIPIASSLNHRRHSTRPDSLAHSPASTAAAAATGGRTIRNRRQSESHASGGGGRKTIHRCEECGKMYKHPNCLSKHRWEHSEQWELTSKLLLTKHQQVQMLEAAAILVSMDSSRKQQQQHPLQQELQQGQLQERQQQQLQQRHAEDDLEEDIVKEEEGEDVSYSRAATDDDDDNEVFIDDMEEEMEMGEVEDGPSGLEKEATAAASLNLHPRNNILAPYSRSRLN